MSVRALFLLGISLILTGTNVYASETRYVSDEMRISLRTRADVNSKLIHTLPSGTPLVVLDKKPQGKFLHVKDPDNTQGWVLERFLMETPAAANILPAIKKELASCQSQSSHQIATIREITTEKEKILSRLESRNHELEETLKETQKTLSKLQSEQDENSSRVQREWFVTGAAVLGVGIIAGLLFASMSRRKQPGNW